MEGAFCDTSDVPTCVAVLTDGEACSGHNQCQSFHCPRGACEPRPKKGEVCDAEICAAGLDCRENVCVTAEAAICEEYGFPGW